MRSANTHNHRLPYGTSRLAGGVIVALAIGLLIAMLFVSTIAAASSGGASRLPDIAHFLRMTALQAGLTTLLSLVSGIAVAWALNRLRFFGRQWVASLFATAIVAPGMVVAFGLIAVWGRAGWVAWLANMLGFDWTGSIFGLGGILAAHTILNGTFAATVLLARLDAIPAARLKTGQSLGLGPLARFRIIDWPVVGGALPGLAAIIFLLAFTSFPIVLLLGGGPANQTLEVAIYAAVRLDFDLRAAIILALTQLAACTFIIAPTLYFTPDLALAGSRTRHHWPEKALVRLFAAAILALALIGFALPLLAVLADGLTAGLGGLFVSAAFWHAALTSLIIGLASAMMAVILAILLVRGRVAAKSRGLRLIIGLPAFVYLIVPAVVLSLGFFLTVRDLGFRPVSAAPFVIAIANTLLTLPFAISVLGPAANAVDRRYGKVMQSLDLSGWRRWRQVEWPLLKPELALVFALGFCFSLGDLGVISLFGTGDFSTLPWLMYRALGAYRSNDAAGIAAVLLVLIFASFWAAPRLIRTKLDA